MTGTTAQVLDMVKKGEFYSERGFDEGNQGFSALDKFTFDTLYNIVEKRASNQETAVLLQKVRASVAQDVPDVGKAAFLLTMLAQAQGLEIKKLLYAEAVK